MNQKLGDNASPYAEKAAEWAKKTGLFNGDGNGNYNWTLPIKREDVAAVLYRDRYGTISDITDKESHDVIRRLADNKIIRGKGGTGEETIIDLPRDIVRVMVYLDRAGVFPA